MAKYSIILPVKNGGEYIKDCVRSILAQTLNDFSLEVLDNCSTDGTLEWLQSLNDSRIRVYPSDTPLSIEDNWGRIVKIPKNEYMTFLGHDDLLDENFLQEMNTFIPKHPNAAIYQAHIRFIDASGKIIRSGKPMDEVQHAPEFLAFFLAGTLDLSIGQVFRSSLFDEVGGIPDYPNLLFADFELWMRLLEKGYKASNRSECCSYRIHISSTTTSSSKLKYHHSFLRLLDFFISLKIKNELFSDVFKKYALDFLKLYCRSISHHILQIPKSKRENVTIKAFLSEFKNRIDILVPKNEFHPQDNFSIKMGIIIDETPFLNRLFLVFKKVYSRPILK